MILHQVLDIEDHMASEGISRVSASYPDKAYEIARSHDTSPDRHPAFNSESVSLWRGDVRSVFENLEVGRFEGLDRSFPIYFTGTRESAVEYTSEKIGDGDRLVVEVEAPYDCVEVYERSVSEIERCEADLNPGKVYFIGTNQRLSGEDEHMEFVATEIPSDWYSVEEL